MNLDRRTFLKGMLATACAPAIVKAENLMNIWVPPEPKIAVAPLHTEKLYRGDLVFFSDKDGYFKRWDGVSPIYGVYIGEGCGVVSKAELDSGGPIFQC